MMQGDGRPWVQKVIYRGRESWQSTIPGLDLRASYRTWDASGIQEEREESNKHLGKIVAGYN